MKNLYIISSIFFFNFICISQNTNLPVGIPYKTRSTENPYIYKNGFKNYFFSTTKIKGLNKILTDIRFDKSYSAFYTSKIMFDNYGKWNKVLKVKKIDKSALVWENVDLFKNGNLYSIYTFGLETNEAIYCSIAIIDANGNDCLQDSYKDKQMLVNYFISKFDNLDSSNLFYTVYWNTFPRPVRVL